MATHDYIISNASGAAVRSDLNNALAAIVSNNSAATEPTTTYAYMWWADTTAGQLKLRNAANDGWVVLQELDGTLLMEDGTVGAPGLAFASDLDSGFYRIGANQLGIATNGTNAIAIDGSQQLGVGISTGLGGLLHVQDTLEATANNNYSLVINGNDGGTDGESASIFLGALNVTTRGASIAAERQSGSNDHDLIFSTSAASAAPSERVRIDSLGRLGLGTSSPTSYSDSEACLTIEDNNSPAICWSDTGQTRDWFAIAQGSALSFKYADGGDTGSPTNVTEVLHLDNGGNVGIGTTSPNGSSGYGSLDLAGSSGTQAGYLAFSDSSGNLDARIFVDNGVMNIQADPSSLTASSAINFRVDASTAATINSSGNVGIGTAIPAAPLHVVGSDSNAQIILTAGNATSNIAQIAATNEAANVWNQLDIRAHEIAFDTASTERMRINSTGGVNVGSGVLSSASSDGNIVVDNGIYIGTYNGDNQIRSSSAGGGSATLYIGNAAIQVSSDIRLKRDIEDTQLDALDAISKIKVKDFAWDDPTDTSYNNRNARGKWTGLIAQELVEVLPFVVNAPRNEDDGSIDYESENRWLLDQSQLCPVLIKAIQQQQEIIAGLESRLSALEAS